MIVVCVLQYDRNENSRQMKKAEILENLKRLHANVVSMLDRKCCPVLSLFVMIAVWKID